MPTTSYVFSQLNITTTFLAGVLLLLSLQERLNVLPKYHGWKLVTGDTMLLNRSVCDLPYDKLGKMGVRVWNILMPGPERRRCGGGGGL